MSSGEQNTPSPRLAGLLYLGAAIGLIGVGIALVISYIHAQIASTGGAYTSFCNVNETVNCDAVLASPFAKLFGIPVAWLAIPAYAGIGALFLFAARETGKKRRQWLRAAAVGVIAAAVFSAFMAYISFAVIKTACLMCMALYAVTGGLVMIVLLALRAHDRSPSQGGGAPTLAFSSGLAVLALTTAGIIGLSQIAWPGATGGHGSGALDNASLDELKSADHEFFDWYTSQPVVGLSEEPRSDWEATQVDPEDGVPVTIVTFSDFECGHCRINHQRLKELKERRPDSTTILYRHFPLSAGCNDALEQNIHPRACRAAEAAECAGKQGKFEDMADILYENQKQLFENNLFRLAERIGIEMDGFRACMDAQDTLPLIRRDAKLGQSLALTSTPTLFFEGRKITGGLKDYTSYEKAVRIESLLRDHQSS